jgi:formate dehydrogenase subunit gamma
VGGGIIALALLGLFGYYAWRGPIGLHGKPTGRLIQRFSDLDRAVHWTIAISFVLLALSGLIITFGKYVLLPVFGYTLFSWLAILAKNLHNFVAPVFFVSLPVFIVLFIRDNLPKMYDFQWIKVFGGMLSKSGARCRRGASTPARKALFWGPGVLFQRRAVPVGGGAALPEFRAGTRHDAERQRGARGLRPARDRMACFHIYLGTIGMKGAYDAMRTGYVDEPGRRSTTRSGTRK